MTAQYHLAVVTYDSSAGHLITRACGDVKVSVCYKKVRLLCTGKINNHVYGSVSFRNFFERGQ